MRRQLSRAGVDALGWRRPLGSARAHPVGLLAANGTGTPGSRLARGHQRHRCPCVDRPPSEQAADALRRRQHRASVLQAVVPRRSHGPNLANTGRGVPRFASAAPQLADHGRGLGQTAVLSKKNRPFHRRMSVARTIGQARAAIARPPNHAATANASSTLPRPYLARTTALLSQRNTLDHVSAASSGGNDHLRVVDRLERHSQPASRRQGCPTSRRLCAGGACEGTRSPLAARRGFPRDTAENPMNEPSVPPVEGGAEPSQPSRTSWPVKAGCGAC